MSIGLTTEELEERDKDSLIKYIGALQTELRLIYERQFPPSMVAVKKDLDFSNTDTLKSTS